MKQRKIDRTLIENCLTNSDKVEHEYDVYKCIKRINDKVLVVIYKRENKNILVITCFKSTKIQKYLK